MIAPTPLVCLRCRHPHDWHRLDDALNLDPTDPATPFRCLGYDSTAGGQIGLFGESVCGCPDLLLRAAPDDGPPPTRDATQAEQNIARAWVDRHRWTNPRDAEVEYEHALAILVFGNARPPLKGKKAQPRARDHAGLGLPCAVCQGPCTIDEPVVRS